MLKWLGKNHSRLPLILSIPHSGEEIPDEAQWLKPHSEKLLLTDVDRFVDELYRQAVENLEIPALMTRVHRYAADLNRYPGDVDAESVENSKNPAGQFTKGFHWVRTTLDQPIMNAPISEDLHLEIVHKYHDRFHEEFQSRVSELRTALGAERIYHLDCHSMPSVGTGAHADQGQKRADVVISDFNGRSAGSAFKDLVLAAFQAQGFSVAYNHPYQGGRITQRYGQPDRGHETIQIELNRSLYMDETTRQKTNWFPIVQNQLEAALEQVMEGLGAADMKKD